MCRLARYSGSLNFLGPQGPVLPCTVIPLGCSTIHPSLTVPLILTALISVTAPLHYEPRRLHLNDWSDRPCATCNPVARSSHWRAVSPGWLRPTQRTTYSCAATRAGTEAEVQVAVSVVCTARAVEYNWALLCTVCVFNRPKAALYLRDKLTMPRIVLAHLTVTLSRKLNVSEQYCTVQHSGLTLTKSRAMDSYCADLFSLCSGL